MRIDSCRKCGKELEVSKKCDVCKKENQFFCHKCGYLTIEQIHAECLVAKLEHSVLKSSITS